MPAPVTWISASVAPSKSAAGSAGPTAGMTSAREVFINEATSPSPGAR
jgi:hypothetical protein